MNSIQENIINTHFRKWNVRICKYCGINKYDFLPWLYGLRHCEECDDIRTLSKSNIEFFKSLNRILILKNIDNDEEELTAKFPDVQIVLEGEPFK